MAHQRRRDIVVDQCSTCQGLWLDASELATLVGSWQDLPRGVSAQVCRDELRCPRCRSSLARRGYSELKRTIIDHCPNCFGIWLDRGELERILQEVYGLP